MWLRQVLSSSFIFLASLALTAQDIENTYNLAEIQFELENYDQAKKLYQRILFFDSLGNYCQSYARLAEISLVQKDKNTAIELLLSYREVLPIGSKESFDVSLKIVSIQLQNNLPNVALDELLKLKEMPLDSSSKQRLSLFLAVAYFQNKEFDSSKTYFKQLIDSVNHDNIEMIFKRNNRLEKRYNALRLQFLSFFLPGSGQMYAGFYKEGINSFLLVGTFVALFVKTTNVYGLLNAMLSVYPWVSRYHIGGVKRMLELSQRKIMIRRGIFYHQLMEMV